MQPSLPYISHSGDWPGSVWMALSILSTACYFVLNTAFLLRHPGRSLHFSLAATHAGAALILLLCQQQPLAAIGWTGALIYRLLALAVLTWLAKILYFYACQHTAVANVTVFSALTPLYAALIAPLMGHPLSAQQLAGIAVVTFSIVCYFGRDGLAGFIKKRRILPGRPSPAGTLAVACAFASTLPTALSTYVQKDAIGLSDPLFISFVICAFSAAASGITLFCVRYGATSAALNRRDIATLLSIAALQALAAFSFSAYVAQGHPAIGQALQRLSSLLQIVLAHIFLRQRMHTLWHVLCVGFSILGLMILFSE